jgi:DNA repair protein RecN (Recombination protein N)
MSLVGGRVESNMVRSGTDRAALEAVFSIPTETKAEIIEILKREELDDDDKFVSLAREIRSEGRSVARVNGRSVNVGLLKELGRFLVDIHGQSEHLSLLDEDSHLGFLDRYAATQAELEIYLKEFRHWNEIRRELKSLRDMDKESARRTELLSFQAQEIEAAQLKPGEEDELEFERSRLANAETLSVSAQQALAILDEGSPDSSSAIDLIGQASQLLASLSRIDPGQQDLSNQIEAVNAQLTEINRDLRGYLDEIEFNPRRLEQVENRLELIHQMKRKYGGSVEAALEFGKNARAQLENIANAGERIAELETAEADSAAKTAAAGQVLSEKRKAAALLLGAAVEKELADLSMPGARFEVSFGEPGQAQNFTESGFDQGRLLYCPQPRRGLKPRLRSPRVEKPRA